MAEVKEISDIIEEISPYYADRKKKKEKDIIPNVAETEHQFIYDSSSEILESIYFFILDLVNEFGFETEKLIDNFTSTPGSQHFSEVGMKASRMQEEASKILGNVNTVVRSVLNLVYDLKDFKIRLQQYDMLNSKDKNTQEAAKLSLKQIWMDRVDINKGNSSIKAMALGQAGFQTLLDGFLVVDDDSLKYKGKEIDLNDRVKRILKQRIMEFNIWLEQSEIELRKRYEIEKNYLRSQVSSLKLYSRWVKPYLLAAQNLEMKDRSREPGLVNMFNTIVFQLTLLGKSKIKIDEAALAGNLPLDLKKIKIERDYYKCILIDFKFRAIPKQGAFIGRTEVTFKAYALTNEELDKLNEELDKSDLSDALKLIQGTTTDSIEQLQEEIDGFLEDKTEQEKEKESKKDQSNPFLALIGYYEKDSADSKDKKSEKEKKIFKKETWVEKNIIRKYVAEESANVCFDIFDIYKKAHGMPSYTS